MTPSLGTDHLKWCLCTCSVLKLYFDLLFSLNLPRTLPKLLVLWDSNLIMHLALRTVILGSSPLVPWVKSLLTVGVLCGRKPSRTPSRASCDGKGLQRLKERLETAYKMRVYWDLSAGSLGVATGWVAHCYPGQGGNCLYGARRRRLCALLEKIIFM